MKESRKVRLLCFVILVFIAFIIGSQYAAGFIFMKIKGLDISFLSIKSFWEFYSNYGDVKSNQIAFLVGFVVMAITILLPVFIIFFIVMRLREKEELFGSARLANDIDLS